jgi:hypothetical protein
MADILLLLSDIKGAPLPPRKYTPRGLMQRPYDQQVAALRQTAHPALRVGPSPGAAQQVQMELQALRPAVAPIAPSPAPGYAQQVAALQRQASNPALQQPRPVNPGEVQAQMAQLAAAREQQATSAPPAQALPPTTEPRGIMQRPSFNPTPPSQALPRPVAPRPTPPRGLMQRPSLPKSPPGQAYGYRRRRNPNFAGQTKF